MLKIREAMPREASLLSELAVRSKAHWGYSQDFMDACRAELAVDESRVGTENYRCFAAVDGDAIAGFYTLECDDAGGFELEALFVEPGLMGSGIGRALVEHAIETAIDAGAKRLVIQGDPNAAGFYIALGARQTGTRASGSIPGRDLPLFEIELADR